MVSKIPRSTEPNFNIIDDIKIYNGTTVHSKFEYDGRIKYLKQLKLPTDNLFTEMEPSTLTAQGAMSDVKFMEEDLIKILPSLPRYILMAGCNYGEIFSQGYKPAVKINTTGRGRKCKIKQKPKRKIQGTGKYFSSQITFVIENPNNEFQYKIKLFRNGVFQVPGIRNPTMEDLVLPIRILRDYISIIFGKNVKVIDFLAVMRNYKSRLVNKNYHVHLEKLENLIFKEKINANYESFLNYMLRSVDKKYSDKIKEMVGNFNPMNVAEMTYNTDRCFSLIIKFYRPSILDPKKKTTVKLLKKGKINFDGGNSHQEVEELYYWLHYIYNKYKNKILFDVTTIKNTYNSDTSSCSEESVYEDSSDSDDTIIDTTNNTTNDIVNSVVMNLVNDTDNKSTNECKYFNNIYQKINLKPKEEY